MSYSPPGVNIKRTPLNGRNFEYLSEDPYLSGELAKEYICGVQSKGIAATLKHYCVNNREYDRPAQSNEVDERALREIYVRPFEIALEAEPWAMMCANNPVNGVYASENPHLLQDILRGELGYGGMMMSDWGAVKSYSKAIRAGLDLSMPYAQASYRELKTAYEDGLLSESEIDACVRRVLKLVERTQESKKEVSYTKAERHAFAAEIAREGSVLLKNEGDVLPLKGKKLALLGGMAETPAICGGGCANVQTAFRQECLAALLERDGVKVDYVPVTCFYNEPTRFTSHLKDGLLACYKSDVAVVCVGNDRLTEAENYDRESLRLTHQEENMILRAVEANENVVVVVYAGSTIDMSAWIDKVKAVLFCGFAGEGTNEVVAEILLGTTNPSGKLSETFPKRIEDTYCKTETGNGFYEWYADGLFVGYRYYDRKKISPQFSFGHGLSYARFEYSDLEIVKNSETDYEVWYTVKNISDTDGKEVSQVYVKDVFSMAVRPEKELKGFSKDLIKAGESKRICVKLNDRAFAYYNTSFKKWHVENGDFEILVGASSSDIRLAGRIEIVLPDETQQSNR